VPCCSCLQAKLSFAQPRQRLVELARAQRELAFQLRSRLLVAIASSPCSTRWTSDGGDG
jgi:hypothetical protein